VAERETLVLRDSALDWGPRKPDHLNNHKNNRNNTGREPGRKGAGKGGRKGGRGRHKTLIEFKDALCNESANCGSPAFALWNE
jgi:hypothetical protein